MDDPIIQELMDSYAWNEYQAWNATYINWAAGEPVAAWLSDEEKDLNSSLYWAS